MSQNRRSSSAIDALSSVEGLTKSAVPILGMWLLYKAAGPIAGFFRGLKEDHDHREQEEDQARRDLVETKRREDKKDTEAINKQVREEWAARERRKLPPRPTAVRGRWEGNVFIPSGEQPRSKR